MNRLGIIFTLAAALVLSSCGGAAEKAGSGSAGANAPSNINATSPSPAADGGANVTAANSAAVVPTPATTGGGNVQQANMPKPQIGSGGNDFFIFTRARGVLNSDDELKAANIIVDVKEGVVTLSGAVRSAAQKSRAEQLVSAGDGVKAVKNQLKVSVGK